MSTPPRPQWVPWLEAAAVVAAAALLTLLVLRLAQSFHSLASLLPAICAALAGYLLADLVTGTVHWFCDTFFAEDTPLIGPLLIAPFREHHRDPLAMTRHSFLELTGNSCLALLPALALALWIGPSPAAPAAAPVYSFILALALAAAATNLFHRWAHDPAPPKFARTLQRLGLILSAEHHAQHHAPPHRTAYCVTNGWANRVADRLGVFARAERVFISCSKGLVNYRHATRLLR